MSVKPQSKIEKLERHVLRSDESACWPWVGMMYPNGYGELTNHEGGSRVRFMAHRVAYETWRGPIPEGLVIDHLCRNRACCNPAHLEPVTAAVNAGRAQGWTDTCKRGHSLTEANIYTAPRSGKHQCRECWKVRRDAKRRVE